MCIMMTADNPDNTKLINIPIEISKKKYKLLIYINNLKLNNKVLKSELSGLSYIDENKEQNNTQALMIVPIPNNSNCDNFGLLNINNNKKFTKTLIEECDKVKPNKPELSLNFGNSSYGSKSLIDVHNIGNYKISVASNIDELFNNIDWDKFKLPDDFDNRKSTLFNTSLYKGNYAYVVAQATKSVKDDGFGIAYPDPDYDYFPTAHEGSGLVDYDVECYNCFSNYLNDSLFHDTFILKNEEIVKKIFTNLKLNLKMSKTHELINYNVLYNNYDINVINIKGQYGNHNLVLSNKKDNIDNIDNKVNKSKEDNIYIKIGKMLNLI